MFTTLPLCRRPRYFFSKNLRSRSRVFDNINKSQDYYFRWVTGPNMLQPAKFPSKGRKPFMSVHLKNPWHNRPGLFPKYVKVEEAEGLTNLEIQKINKEKSWTDREILKAKKWGYAPAHSFINPEQSLAKYENIEIDHLSEEQQDIFTKLTSYEFAGKQLKQQDTFERVINLVRKEMTFLTPFDMKKDGLIYRCIYYTVHIRNMQENIQELFAIRRYENLRLQNAKFKEMRKELNMLIELRAYAMGKLKMRRIEVYVGLMELLNMEIIDPPRRSLPRISILKHDENRAHLRVGRAALDKRIAKVSKKPLNIFTSGIDFDKAHRENYLSHHTAAVIDMRIRTFHQLEQQGTIKEEEQEQLDHETNLAKLKIINDHMDKIGFCEIDKKRFDLNLKEGSPEIEILRQHLIKESQGKIKNDVWKEYLFRKRQKLEFEIRARNLRIDRREKAKEEKKFIERVEL